MKTSPNARLVEQTLSGAKLAFRSRTGSFIAFLLVNQAVVQLWSRLKYFLRIHLGRQIPTELPQVGDYITGKKSGDWGSWEASVRFIRGGGKSRWGLYEALANCRADVIHAGDDNGDGEHRSCSGTVIQQPDVLLQQESDPSTAGEANDG